ncbi:UDP-N-acetylmuramoyl-tripeptide--D-alanyl-D-alanine ligase [Psychromonas sp. SP041]|uniref:UDP-N-acetylmuramoyl-tripeptide--D-alanyl-D- alanine ligase n=1 Tax=Psychromonas sp. SP041 TaxID=1365007 RepID=UPI0010C7B717|nr:UDP-N-acetylmuramoyl-tripeptide--D-alanyl-D-alanine ligase [Psychromonas sp. SP041]
MITLSVEQLCNATKGNLKAGYASLSQSAAITFNNVSTDTRTIKSNDLFIALKGPSFDAHQLLQSALDKGASVLLVEANSTLTIPTDSLVVEVEDTRIALGLLGRYIKQQITGLKCAAITGSNGKTTCKELLSAILTAHSGNADKVLATAGNFNNDIGLPLTLLRLEAQHQFAVLELGANHIGEIAYTAALAKPDVALVNNVMPAHLEGFGSLEGVATAKSEIWSSLASDGVAVVNLDANFADDFIKKLQNKQQPLITFSRETETDRTVDADLFATELHSNELGQSSFILNVKTSMLFAQKQAQNESANSLQNIQIQLNLPGKHNVSNALAASAMALALGCSLNDIQQGLQTLQQVAGRVNYAVVSDTLTVIDDTYNANSASVSAGIDLLAQYPCERLLICGDMGELGHYAEQEHQTIGEYAQQHNINRLFTVGNLSQQATNAYNAASKNAGAEHFSDKQQLKSAISAYLGSQKSKVVVLVKGSRSAKMEEIVAFIKQEFGA